jgi:uncharacterized protein (TIGR03435 family)
VSVRAVVGVLAMACAAGAPALAAQPAQGGSAAEFEVASVRAVPPGHEGMTSVSPWGSDLFVARNLSLRNLIALAYGGDERNIDGLADKVGDGMFDVEARVEGQQKLNYEQMQPLLQNLLRERFHLAAHRGTRLEKGYALVVAKGGAKVKAAKAAGGSPSIVPDGIYGRGIGMDMLAGLLARPLGAPVEDETGLRGSYDVALRYRTMDADDSSLPSIFTALQEQLGLKVVRAKVPVPVLIVDHVDAEPTAQ